MKQIAEVGNEAPYFAAKGQHGRVIRLNNYIGKMNLVMFFMKDTGAKSVVQALEFNEWVGYFHQGHCAVLGICPERPDVLRKFSKENKLMYQLLSDENLLVFSAYQSFGRFGRPCRSTVVIRADGIVAHITRKPFGSEHINKAKKVVQEVSESLSLAK